MRAQGPPCQRRRTQMLWRNPSAWAPSPLTRSLTVSSSRSDSAASSSSSSSACCSFAFNYSLHNSRGRNKPRPRLLPSEDMKDAPDSLPTAAGGGGPGKRRYKLWALAAVLLLALWSMLTGTVTLKRSAGHPSDDLGGPALEDLDVLEMEERQKVVRRMWDTYAHRHGSSSGRLPKFWQAAFEAAYEDLAGDDPAARDAAVAEIARISMRMVDLHPSPPSPKNGESEKKEHKSNPPSLSSVKAQ